jgi:hypothetical protein
MSNGHASSTFLGHASALKRPVSGAGILTSRGPPAQPALDDPTAPPRAPATAGQRRSAPVGAWNRSGLRADTGVSPLRLLSTFDLGEPPDSGRIGDCCREDCPFQPVRVAAPGLVSVALAPVARHANLDCRQAVRLPPWLSPGTLLCAARTFLGRRSTAIRDHPFALLIRLSTCGQGPRALPIHGAEGEI